MKNNHKKYKITTNKRELLADTLTPVGIYLQVRDLYPNSILLESSDYHGKQNSKSFICCKSIAKISLEENNLTMTFPDGTLSCEQLSEGVKLMDKLSDFMQSFDIEASAGLYGYMAYDVVQHFDKLSFDGSPTIPLLQYDLFRYVIAIDHFSNTIVVKEFLLESEQSTLSEFVQNFSNHHYTKYGFDIEGKETSNYTDEEFLPMIQKGIDHCHLGDVFQIVLSRHYQQGFKGDEFNVYRALRSVNPSPYLFYFDYGAFKLMGSSPEAQLVVEKGKASIHPIAGTFKRTGNDKADLAIAEELKEDKKENSEHVMLVDLARNDLSRVSEQVNVEIFKEVQFYSHVIHLVSKVTGEIDGDASLPMIANTFPAGTLSGAPKYKAMELIETYENQPRGFYGGAIGFIGFGGTVNLAIMIRSLMSQQGSLHYQAGAGIVSKSFATNELQEVEHKLAAVRKAIQLANKI